MDNMIRCVKTAILSCVVAVVLAGSALAAPRDLDDIRKDGTLRHLGVTYANFVTGLGDGLDVELMKLFAEHLGVRYEFVQTDWDNVLTDLTGITFTLQGSSLSKTGTRPIKGDVVANGLTILDWRHALVDFSVPTFPTQVWVVARSDSAISPIKPTGDIRQDIALTRAKLDNVNVLCKTGGCLDPALYDLDKAGARPQLFPGSPNDLAPAVILGEAEVSLLDVPDALVALQKYPGKIKVIGPMSETQDMAVGFAREQPRLREEFDRFFASLKSSGGYDKLVKKYYPLVYNYYPAFFAR